MPALRAPVARLTSVTFFVSAVLTAAALAPATTYTSVSVNSATSVANPAPDSATSDTGAPLQLSAASTTNRAFSNGAGGFAIMPVTDDVFALASLADAQLKTRAILGFGTNSGAAMPAGVRNGSASANASFADSFSTVTNTGSPFLWASGDNAAFQFSVTGQYSVPPNVLPPTSAASPKNLVLGTLRFQALAPGGLDLRHQLQTFDFANRPFNEYQALNSQYEAKRLPGGFGFWYLGDPVADFTAGSDPVLAVNPSSPTNVNFSFNPNGDFEWFLELDNTVQLDASLQNTTVTLDFSHTIQTTYTPPPGATTLSSSGVFPGTLPVPEPTTALLAACGLALPLLRRRSTR